MVTSKYGLSDGRALSSKNVDTCKVKKKRF